MPTTPEISLRFSALKICAIVDTVPRVKNHIWSTLSRAAAQRPDRRLVGVEREAEQRPLVLGVVDGRRLERARLPARSISIVTGSAALQPFFTEPFAHLCVAICSRSASGSPRHPSTARMRSPFWSTAAAGDLERHLLDAIGRLGSPSPIDQIRTIRIRNASTMLTAGPAPITTSRFHTGWR